MAYPARSGDRPGGGARGYRWAQFCKLVIATYGDVCHLCGHGGARQVDHLEAVTEHPELAWDLARCRPAHGTPGNRCPVCGLACNQLRGYGSVERGRRKVAERQAQKVKKPRPQVSDPETGRDAGRDW